MNNSRLLLEPQEKVEYETWLDKPNDYDFVMFSMEIVRILSPESAYIKSIIDWKNTKDVKILAELSGLSKSTIKRHIKKLQEFGFVDTEENISQEQIKEKLFSYEKRFKCEWCNQNVYLIEEHHYPIPKRQGGTDVVKICPTCHRTFHNIELKYNKNWK